MFNELKNHIKETVEWETFGACVLLFIGFPTFFYFIGIEPILILGLQLLASIIVMIGLYARSKIRNQENDFINKCSNLIVKDTFPQQRSLFHEVMNELRLEKSILAKKEEFAILNLSFAEKRKIEKDKKKKEEPSFALSQNVFEDSDCLEPKNELKTEKKKSKNTKPFDSEDEQSEKDKKNKPAAKTKSNFLTEIDSVFKKTENPDLVLSPIKEANYADDIIQNEGRKEKEYLNEHPPMKSSLRDFFSDVKRPLSQDQQSEENSNTKDNIFQRDTNEKEKSEDKDKYLVKEQEKSQNRSTPALNNPNKKLEPALQKIYEEEKRKGKELEAKFKKEKEEELKRKQELDSLPYKGFFGSNNNFETSESKADKDRQFKKAAYDFFNSSKNNTSNQKDNKTEGEKRRNVDNTSQYKSSFQIDDDTPYEEGDYVYVNEGMKFSGRSTPSKSGFFRTLSDGTIATYDQKLTNEKRIARLKAEAERKLKFQ